MAIRIKAKTVKDITELLNYQSTYVNLNIKYKLGTPFNEPKFLYACAETLGYDDLTLIEVDESDKLLDIFVFVKTHEGVYGTPIPYEIPHFLYFPSLIKYPSNCFELLQKQLDTFVIYNSILHNHHLDFLQAQSNNYNVKENTLFVLDIPSDFERWIYRAKPKSQEKYSKILKLLNKTEFTLKKWSDPLSVQEKIYIAFDKGTELPLITKEALSSLYFQLKLAGYEILYTTLQAENYDLTGAILLSHESNLYIFQIFNFTDDRKNSLEELHLMRLVEVAAQEGKNKLILFSDFEPPILRYEQIKIHIVVYKKM